MAQIDYYFTVLSPFTYLAGTRLEGVAAKHSAQVSYKPFNIGEVGKHTGFVPLPQRPEARKRYRLQELDRIANHFGLPINKTPTHWPMNPVPASSAVISAQRAGGGDLGKFCFALFRSCWADEQDISTDAVIRACLGETGFDPDLVGADMLGAVEEFEKNTNDALAASVFGSPTYVVGDQVFWGQDRIDYLDQYLGELS